MLYLSLTSHAIASPGRTLTSLIPNVLAVLHRLRTFVPTSAAQPPDAPPPRVVTSPVPGIVLAS